MRIALGQLASTVGDFEGNLARCRELRREAAARGADLLLLPEQVIPGYPARDLLEVSDFVRRNVAAFESLKGEPGLPTVVGHAEPHGGPGAGLYNAAALIGGAGAPAVARKLLLPTYDVFDEGRWFDPGTEVTVAEVGGVRIGLTICEDVWNDKAFWSRRRYVRDPVEEAVARGAQLVVNVSASPFTLGKPRLRERMVGAAARRHGVPIALCNLVGGNDSLVFDGSSFAVDAAGQVIARARAFAEDLVVVELAPTVDPRPGAPGRPEEYGPVPGSHASPAELDELLEALALGLRDYARRTGFRSAVLGLSGGIDSALTAVIAVRALGAGAVRALAMPSRHSSPISEEDARRLATRLGIRLDVIAIEEPLAALERALGPVFEGKPPDVAEENLQARIRGTLLMGVSNKHGDLLLTTGNKSELGVGYCTLYGDMAGGLSVIGDLPKTLVYALARHVNRDGEVIPARTIERAPTAELRPDQTDQDSLPPYEVLDRILQAHVVERLSFEEIVGRGEDEAVVRRVLGLLIASEYKRRQAAPILKVTPRAFGEGWRFPIAHRFRY